MLFFDFCAFIGHYVDRVPTGWGERWIFGRPKTSSHPFIPDSSTEIKERVQR
jgi:hypothetical protein